MPREQNRSAPNHFLERVNQFLNTLDYQADNGDSVWFVMDVDRWKREEIDTLIIHCQGQADWHMAISNPCFEVWLHFYAGLLLSVGATAIDLKTQLNQRFRGGYRPELACLQLATAATNARRADRMSKVPFSNFV